MVSRRSRIISQFEKLTFEFSRVWRPSRPTVPSVVEHARELQTAIDIQGLVVRASRASNGHTLAIEHQIRPYAFSLSPASVSAPAILQCQPPAPPSHLPLNFPAPSRSHLHPLCAPSTDSLPSNPRLLLSATRPLRAPLLCPPLSRPSR